MDQNEVTKHFLVGSY